MKWMKIHGMTSTNKPSITVEIEVAGILTRSIKNQKGRMKKSFIMCLGQD